MSWSFTVARRAAASVRAQELGREAIRTIRPRSVVGVFRVRAPLPILLYVAARDGLVVEQDGEGFAVLQLPLVDRSNRSGGYDLRLLRFLDRHWDMAAFVAPPLLGFAAGAATIPFESARLFGIATVILLDAVWIAVLLAAMLVYQLGSLTRMGQPATRRHDRAAESLPGYHWSAPLVHQPDPGRVDELIGLMTERLRRLILDRAQQRVGGKARITGQVTETLVVVTAGISTQRTRRAIADSLRTVPGGTADGGVIVLAAPSRMEKVARRPISGGSVLLLYAVGLAVVIAVLARSVADIESAVCGESCVGRPSTYGSALHWLLQRLLFTDPPSISPATGRVAVLGLLVSAAAAMFVVVAFVAAQQEIDRNRQVIHEYDERMTTVTQRTRTLILVVTETERQAVMEAVQKFTGTTAAQDSSGPRTMYLLGTVGSTEVLLAQAGQQGVAEAAGMLVSALRLLPHTRPDYVVLTGICFGLRPDEGQQIGDIIIGRRIQGLDHRKVTDAGTIRRGVNVGCSPFLLDRFQAGQVTWTDSRVHIGTILTSNTLVDSRTFVDQLRSEFPDAIAGEMEGIGVSEAVTEEFKPDWIVVKAISDWGLGKSDVRQPEAAGNVARFVVEVLVNGALRGRDNYDSSL